MKPISAVPFKEGFVVIGEDGSVHRYEKAKKRWTTLAPVPDTDAADNKSMKRRKRKRFRKPLTPLTPTE